MASGNNLINTESTQFGLYGGIFHKKECEIPYSKNKELGYEKLLNEGGSRFGTRPCLLRSIYCFRSCDYSDNTRIFFIPPVILTVKLIHLQLKFLGETYSLSHCLLFLYKVNYLSKF